LNRTLQPAQTHRWSTPPVAAHATWVGFACLAAVALGGPLLLIPNPASATGAVFLAPIVGVLGVRVFFPNVAGSVTTRSARLADVALLGLLGMAGIGALVGGDARVSLPRLTGLWFAAGVYAAIRLCVVDLRNARVVTWLLTLAGLAIATLGLVGTAWLTEYSKAVELVPIYDRLPRLIRNVPAAHGVIGGFHPNEVGGVLAVLLPVAVACGVAELRVAGGRRRLWAMPAAAAVLAMVIYLLLSVSRNSLLSAGVGVLAVLVGYAPRQALRLSPVVVVGALVGGILARRRVTQALLASDLTWSTEAWDRPTRPEIWQRALQMIRDHPWAGAGLNAFPYVIQTDYPFARFPDFLVPHAHNLYLQTAVDYGLPGLLCFLVLMAGGIAGAMRTRSGDQAARSRWMALGVIGALSAYAAFGVLDAVAVGAKPTFLPFAVIALGISLGWVSEKVIASGVEVPVEDALVRPASAGP
jgi:hypothetical protein